VGDPLGLRKAISQLAGRQWGHITRGELRDLGVPGGTVDAWVHDGRLIVVHPGVYAVGYRREEPVARACAAVLACGPLAVLSHDSALALWELRRWERRLEVTLTAGDRRPEGLWVHRSRTLPRAEITRQYGIPVTRTARALADMRGRLTQRQFVRLTNDARLKHILTADEAERLLHHRRNPTRSGLEDDLQRWLERHDLPQPQINTKPGGREVDAVWHAQRVIVELDDYATHGDAAAFADDRARDFDHLTELDYVTVRLIREWLTAETAERLRRLLARRTPGA
jgi:hypothetical protein